ncbi:uncharacterized protein EV422DRAFT_613485 [Fimicolochytrium jonesii]|uniref:uncharacterized protein n=1 Tax=Fimicolochytrium jonesii TaxID=1396493 RepID=UPI0022FE8392|nr:uncharacterized protein EV422DRAFT_613485 [Fimicolochytrium jonesii]KAI8822419.1 hypothetical protein EV422DRAFT_613485 [Fimicolochytrium jonesii]
MNRSTSIASALATAISDPIPFFSFSSTPDSDRKSQNATPTGLVEVSSAATGREREVELEKLERVPKFQPLLPSSLSPQGFSWGGLFTSNAGVRGDELPFALNPEPTIQLWTKCRTHIRSCTEDVVKDQKHLSAKMTDMEEYCTKLANTVANRCYDAKVHGEKLAALLPIQKQAERTATTLDDLLISLEKLEPLLPPKEQMSDPEMEKRYPALSKLLANRRMEG